MFSRTRRSRASGSLSAASRARSSSSRIISSMASATWVGIAPQAELTNAAMAARTARTSASPRRHRATWSVTRARTAFPRAWRIGRVACISGLARRNSSCAA